MIVGIAGPLSNFLLAIAVSFMIKLRLTMFIPLELLKYFMIINVLLAIFNLIPIPPLDGSRIAVGLLPSRFALQYIRLERYGFLVLFALIWLGLFQIIVWPLALFVLQFLL